MMNDTQVKSFIDGEALWEVAVQQQFVEAWVSVALFVVFGLVAGLAIYVFTQATEEFGATLLRFVVGVAIVSVVISGIFLWRGVKHFSNPSYEAVEDLRWYLNS